MPRIQPLDPKKATGQSKELLDAIAKKFGKAPNVLKNLAHSPAALQVYTASSQALEGSSLSAKTRERIALLVAEINNCVYCLAAHSAKGKMVGLSADDLIESRRVESVDPKTAAKTGRGCLHAPFLVKKCRDQQFPVKMKIPWIPPDNRILNRSKRAQK